MADLTDTVFTATAVPEEKRTAIINDILLAERIHPERRWSDRLDFHDLAVWTLREMLGAAFDAGAAYARR